MNPAYTKARLTQIDRKIHQTEEDLRELKKERIKIKEGIVKARKET